MIPDAGGYSSYRVLQTEIAALYGEVREVLAPEQSASKQARALLSEASIMLKGQPEDLDVVEDKVHQVREILRQAQASQQNADTYGRPILIYLSAWLVLSLGAIVYFYLDSSLLSQGLGRHANALIITLFWGAIGGVLSATHSLWWHTSEAQDYDHRFNASYVVRPVIGMILGGLIYAIIAFAFDTFSLDLPGNLLLGLIPSLLALIAGFRSGQLLRLGRLFPQRDMNEPSPAPLTHVEVIVNVPIRRSFSRRTKPRPLGTTTTPPACKPSPMACPQPWKARSNPAT